MQYHPHTYFIVPGEGLSQNAGKWLALRQDFYINVRALSNRIQSRFQNPSSAVTAAKTCSYGYGFEIDQQKGHSEWLFHAPKGKEAQLLVRENGHINTYLLISSTAGAAVVAQRQTPKKHTADQEQGGDEKRGE